MGCFGEWRCEESWVRTCHAAGSRVEMLLENKWQASRKKQKVEGESGAVGQVWEKVIRTGLGRHMLELVDEGVWDNGKDRQGKLRGKGYECLV